MNQKPNITQTVPFYMVTDMTKSLEFYVDKLGFEIINTWQPTDKIYWCWIKKDRAALMLQEYREGFKPGITLGAGVSIYFICEDALTIYHQLKTIGLNTDRPFVGNANWVVGIADPDGYRMYFESPTDELEGTLY